jgi:signal transduction histidine kinase
MDFEGTGTGLAISQRIVALHRGTIRADSQPNQGCTVSIGLPS